MNNLILADLAVSTGSGLVHDLFVVLVIAICVGIVWAVGRWFITKLGAPALVLTVWNGFFILIGAIIIINFLLSLTGHGFVSW